MTIGIDWSVIDKYEITTDFGYAIPNDDKSGITIASGFDLGQHSASQIDRLPVTDAIKEKLKPYARLKGSEARRALVSAPESFDPRLPIHRQIKEPIKRVVSNGASSAYVFKSVYATLNLSETEVAQLNNAVRQLKLARVVEKFDRATATSSGKHFKSIPASCQTAIVSFCWQYGENIGDIPHSSKKRRLRDFWDATTRSDWAGAIERLLQNFISPAEKSFARRRYEEVFLLMHGMKMGERPGPRLQQLLQISEIRSRTA